MTTPTTPSAAVEEKTLADLLAQPKLTNRESADAIRIIANRQMATAENITKIYNAMKEVGKHLDRLEKAVFDTKEGETLRPGIARSLRETQLTVGTLQRNLTEVHLHNQVMRRLLPWLSERMSSTFARKTIEDTPPTIEEINATYQALLEDLVQQGEKAAAYQDQIEEVITKSRHCMGCAWWRELVAPGVEPGCQRKFIQVKCPSCSTLIPKPLNPNALGNCPKCQAELFRMTLSPTTLYCANYDPSIAALRQSCLEKGVPAEVVDVVFPPNKEPHEKATTEDGACAGRAPSDEVGGAGR